MEQKFSKKSQLKYKTKRKNPKVKKVSKSVSKETADRWFSKFIRLRDLIPESSYCACVTCGRSHHWKDLDCGHFATREKPLTRYHEKNCHAQCKKCNMHGKGEQTKHGFVIDKKYGVGTAEMLINLSETRGTKIPVGKALGGEALKEISDKYRKLVKKLAKEKGIVL